MYDACRLFARHVQWEGGLQWDWSEVLSMDPPQEFVDLIRSYLRSVLESEAEDRGWKIPETTLCFPWIQRMFPETKYIFWIRDPRDSIIGSHLTDDLTDFGIEYEPTNDQRLRRAISWQYQYLLVKATPKPAQWIEVRFEDFVLKQEETLARLKLFLGMELARIPVRTDPVGRWRVDDKDDSTGPNCFDFFHRGICEYGYEFATAQC